MLTARKQEGERKNGVWCYRHMLAEPRADLVKGCFVRFAKGININERVGRLGMCCRTLFINLFRFVVGGAALSGFHLCTVLRGMFIP